MSADTNKRGVLYIIWGEGMEMTIDRSIASVQRLHPELKIHVQRLPEGATLLEKSRMMEFSPFDETLYLDIDTIVLGDLSFAFEKASLFGAACAICENPWARRYGGLGGDMVEYNTGVLFFTKKAAPLFDAWKLAVGEVDSSLVHIVDGGKKVRMPLNDQAGFARAVEVTELATNTAVAVPVLAVRAFRIEVRRAIPLRRPAGNAHRTVVRHVAVERRSRTHVQAIGKDAIDVLLHEILQRLVKPRRRKIDARIRLQRKIVHALRRKERLRQKLTRHEELLLGKVRIEVSRTIDNVEQVVSRRLIQDTRRPTIKEQIAHRPVGVEVTA